MLKVDTRGADPPKQWMQSLTYCRPYFIPTRVNPIEMQKEGIGSVCNQLVNLTLANQDL